MIATYFQVINTIVFLFLIEQVDTFQSCSSLGSKLLRHSNYGIHQVKSRNFGVICYILQLHGKRL